MTNYPNMSYCAFENTVAALNQIRYRLQDVSSMQELLDDASSMQEQQAIRDFFDMLPELCEEIENLSEEG